LTLTGVCGILLNLATSDVTVLALACVIVAINAMGIGHISSVVVDLFPTHLRYVSPHRVSYESASTALSSHARE